MDNIRYLKHTEIDQKRWDEAIDNSVNGLVYSYSFFLNSMCPGHWDALVLGNYEAVFPLVWNKRLGMRFLYQPFFCQQLGLFSRSGHTDDLLPQFLNAIPAHFRYWNFHLNYNNHFYDAHIRQIKRSSYCIPLITGYETIRSAYRQDARKNLNRAAALGYRYGRETGAETAAECFFAAYGTHYKDAERIRMQITSCANTAISLGKGFNRSVHGPDGTLWCSGFFFISHKRIHYAMAAPTEEGKVHAATHILIDEVLKEFAGQDLIFDFEGSDIPSVAYFYAKFGSTAMHYPQIISNRLPFWCRFLKES